MIAYLESNGEDKEIVFAQVLGERNEVRKNIDGSKYGNFIDKYCLRKYLSEAMLLNYSGFNESMYCHPSDILENIELDFDKLEEIFNDSDYDNFIKTAYVYANRLLMLKLDIMPIVKFKEISRVKYDEDKKYDEVFLNSLNLNTEIIKLINARKDLENVDNMFDEDNAHRPIEENNDKKKELKIRRKLWRQK